MIETDRRAVAVTASLCEWAPKSEHHEAGCDLADTAGIGLVITAGTASVGPAIRHRGPVRQLLFRSSAWSVSELARL